QYAHIVSSTTDMLALLDAEFVYLAANATYLKAFGKTRDELVGRSVPEIFGEELFRTVIRPHAERCLAGEDIRYQDWFDFPTDGRKYMDVAYSPYLGSDDEIRGFVVTARDITERRRAEEALRIERDKLKGVLDGVGEGMYIVNREYTVEFQNEIFENLFPGGVGDKCHVAYMGSAAPCATCNLCEAISSGEIQRLEVTFVDGKDFDITFSPFTELDGEVKAIVLARDISEKKILQAEAARAWQLASLGELAAGVAHEINNPVNGIISYAEVLKDECEDKGEEDVIPARIIKEGMRVAAIVRNLLSFAREHSASPAPVHPRAILSDALGLVESRLKLDGIKLDADIPAALPLIDARAHEIQQVFLNLISNARYALGRKFPARHKDKILEIKGEAVMIQGRQYIRITFRDAGPGIPGKILDKIINPFFSTKPPGQGTGLGLSISHGLIEAHGGKLRFESVEGEYTRVIVDLPVERGKRE
ncbi:MAG: PAS domain-containing protein, partial [Desulfobacterales bacterium]|nr:PAS domain-containing protein [Desulfobacterales bacterium]